MTLKDELKKTSITCDEINKIQQVTVSQRQQKFISLSTLKKICEKHAGCYEDLSEFILLEEAISEIEKEDKKESKE